MENFRCVVVEVRQFHITNLKKTAILFLVFYRLSYFLSCVSPSLIDSVLPHSAKCKAHLNLHRTLVSLSQFASFQWVHLQTSSFNNLLTVLHTAFRSLRWARVLVGSRILLIHRRSWFPFSFRFIMRINNYSSINWGARCILQIMCQIFGVYFPIS